MGSKALAQITAVMIKNILLLTLGLSIGFTTILIPGLTATGETFNIGPEELSWIGSIQSIFVPIGCLLSGAVSQALGRRKAMQIVNIPFIVSWLLFYFCDAEWQLFLALCLAGLTGGFLEAPVLTYVAEISEPRLRGMLSSTASVAVIFGVMLMFCLGAVMHWRLVALVSSVFHVASFFCLYFIPESPYWLISKNKFLDARKSLAWLRGWTDLENIEADYAEIYNDIHKSRPAGLDNLGFDGTSTKDVSNTTEQTQLLDRIKPYLKKNFLVAFALVFIMFFLNNFTGMNNLQTYAVQIFETFNAPVDKYYCAIIMGVLELLGTIVSMWAVYSAGKRIVNFISLIINGTVFLIVASYAYKMEIFSLKFSHSSNSTDIIADIPSTYNENLTWLPFICLVSTVFFTHIGLKVVPWILAGEVFSNETRALGAGLCGASTYIMNFVVSKTFYKSIESFTLPGVFWVYASISYAGCIVLYFIQPETEGYTLGKIQEHFSGGEKLGKKIFRKRENLKQENSPTMHETDVRNRGTKEIYSF